MMTAFTGNVKDADIMLVQNGLYFRAIMLNIQLFRWQRFLNIFVYHSFILNFDLNRLSTIVQLATSQI